MDNTNNLPTVNHLDGNKINNDVTNLQWASYSEQVKHTYSIGIRKPPIGLTRKVCQYNLNNDLIKTFDSISQASRETKTNQSHISQVCLGKQYSSNNFIWKYS